MNPSITFPNESPKIATSVLRATMLDKNCKSKKLIHLATIGGFDSSYPSGAEKPPSAYEKTMSVCSIMVTD
jgi:hypothetical protein